MNGGRRLRIDPATMETAGAGLARAGTDLEAAMSRLRADLGAQGLPWGDDEIGRAFGGDYLQIVQHAFQAIGTYRDQIQYAATQLPVEAQRFRTTEQDNTAEFENFWPVPPDRQ